MIYVHSSQRGVGTHKYFSGQRRYALFISQRTNDVQNFNRFNADSSLIKKSLSELGFCIEMLEVGQTAAGIKQLCEFRDNLAVPGSIGFIYAFGIGNNDNSQGYQSGRTKSDWCQSLDFSNGSLQLSQILSTISGNHAKCIVLILDGYSDTSIRCNYSEAQQFISNAEPKVLLAVTAKRGERCYTDSLAKNSIYASQLATQLANPTTSLQEMLQKVHDAVAKKTRFRQNPILCNGLDNDVYLTGLGLTQVNASAKALVSKKVTIRLTGVPLKSDIKVDGKVVHGGVFTDTISCAMKSYTLSVKSSGYEQYQCQIVVHRGGSVVHRVVLEPIRKQYPRVRHEELKKYLGSLCDIPAGSLLMGSLNGFEDEQPVHKVDLQQFRLCSTPVTVAVWKEYCLATGIKMPPAPDWGFHDDHPIVYVSWEDIVGTYECDGFCSWASEMVGYRVTIPTEAQWEYAARGGNYQKEYPWGDKYDDSKVWCSVLTKRRSTVPVLRSHNMYRNVFGLIDVAGNVSNWCLDDFGLYLENKLSKPIVFDELADPMACVRGGTWANSQVVSLRCTTRGGISRSTGSDGMSFRLCTSHL